MRLWHILVICIIAGVWTHYGDEIKARYLPGMVSAPAGGSDLQLTASRKRMSPFTAQMLDGTEISSANLLQGRPSMIVFFAGWCPHCANEMKHLKALKRKAPGVRFIGIIHNDTEKSAQNMMRLHGNPFDRLLIDASNKAGKSVGLRGVPNHFLVDRNGMLRLRIDGAITDDQHTRLYPLLAQLEQE